MQTTNLRKMTLTSSEDELQLALLCTTPAEGQETKGILQLVHGMCEHKERYIPFMQFMSEHGWICVIHDHRGHGASVRYPNELGYFYEGGWKAMVNDVRLVSDRIRQEYPGQPLSMLGHSMGSMVVRSYLKENDDQLRKLVVCGSPSKNPAAGIGIRLCRHAIKHYGGMSRPRLIQKMSFGSFNKPFKHEGSPNAWICSDKKVVEAYDKNPLCQYQFTANGFYNLMSLMQDTYNKEGWKLRQPDLPVHFISGEQDPCIGSPKKFRKAVRFLQEAGYRQVTGKLYPGMRHEILNEIDKATVWKDVLDFLEK